MVKHGLLGGVHKGVMSFGKEGPRDGTKTSVTSNVVSGVAIGGVDEGGAFPDG